ncbi:CopG family transcriptional regulator [filamentous cyanobacterium CCT1]|nr:CopG family transcriptional regulator [filamentous cyanobacterium CCT1]PSN78305.1 CopG family transcriptional regulator [filamentous cyanobacterium CCP4]
MNSLPTTAVQTEVPTSLIVQAQRLIDAGWFNSMDDIMLSALRRFLDSHRDELMEDYIRQDVEWGLRGND